jgi:hypothetical protein
MEITSSVGWARLARNTSIKYTLASAIDCFARCRSCGVAEGLLNTNISSDQCRSCWMSFTGTPS